MIKDKIIPIIEERERFWTEGQDAWDYGLFVVLFKRF